MKTLQDFSYIPTFFPYIPSIFQPKTCHAKKIVFLIPFLLPLYDAVVLLIFLENL